MTGWSVSAAGIRTRTLAWSEKDVLAIEIADEGLVRSDQGEPPDATAAVFKTEP